MVSRPVSAPPFFGDDKFLCEALIEKGISFEKPPPVPEPYMRVEHDLNTLITDSNQTFNGNKVIDSYQTEVSAIEESPTVKTSKKAKTKKKSLKQQRSKALMQIDEVMTVLNTILSDVYEEPCEDLVLLSQRVQNLVMSPDYILCSFKEKLRPQLFCLMDKMQSIGAILDDRECFALVELKASLTSMFHITRDCSLGYRDHSDEEAEYAAIESIDGRVLTAMSTFASVLEEEKSKMTLADTDLHVLGMYSTTGKHVTLKGPSNPLLQVDHSALFSCPSLAVIFHFSAYSHLVFNIMEFLCASWRLYEMFICLFLCEVTLVHVSVMEKNLAVFLIVVIFHHLINY